MKKLINDPQDVMRESLAGFAAAHADILNVSFDPVYVTRRGRAGRRQGGHRFGRRQRSRTPARRIRGPGHARCRLSRPGLHIPESRPDGSGHRRCRWRSRRAPHRQELHRRRYEFRNGRRTVPGAWHRGGVGRHQRRRRGAGQPLHGRPPRHGADSAGGKDLRRRRRPRLRSLPRGRAGPQGECKRPFHGHGLDAPAPCPPPANRTFELGDNEIEMGVGIHGEPGRERMPPPAGRNWSRT